MTLGYLMYKLHRNIFSFSYTLNMTLVYLMYKLHRNINDGIKCLWEIYKIMDF